MKINKFKDFISSKYPNIEVISNLSEVKYRDKIPFICSKHGNKISRYDHLITYGCKDCNRENFSNDQLEKFVKRSNKVHNNKYDYSNVNYINNKTPVIINCKDHGTFEQRPDNHIAGAGCTFCNYKLSTDQFIEKSKKIHGDKFLYDKTNYINYRSCVTIGCKKHGYFQQLARVNLSGFGCPKCSESRGESTISDYLIEKKIKFERQYKFENCFFKNKLAFDFYLTELNCCIEYNGYQHYYPVKYFGGENNFEEQVLKDKIKKDYCQKNNIDLLIIKYNENTTEKLREYLIQRYQ
jgi:hypothetical protein